MQKELKREFYNTMTSKLWGLLEKPEDKRPTYCYGEEEITKRFNALKMSLQNHEETVLQNRSLQRELNDLEKKPFFPYALNSGNGADYGEFILISHAWFTIPNLPVQLGIVEVEWKKSKARKMYLGAGCTNGKDFNKDVLSIALHGQKIKDSSEGF